MNTNLLFENKVAKGESYKSYAALCKYIGIPITTGKQRLLDQRHLKCYFDWEKTKTGNKLTIMETYYEAPKEFEDRHKNGIRTTVLGGMMQQLILNFAKEKKFYSKIQLLKALGVWLDYKSSRRDRIDTYIERCYDMKIIALLDGALHQLAIKKIARVEQIVVYGSKKQLLDREKWNLFHSIQLETIRECGEKNQYMIYKKKKWNIFQSRLNKKTSEQIGKTDIKNRIVIWNKGSYEKKNVDYEIFFQLLRENILLNYKRRNQVERGFGIIRPWEEMKARVPVLVQKKA